MLNLEQPIFIIALLFLLCMMTVLFITFLFRRHWLAKLQVANAFGNLFILFLAAYAFYSGRPDFIDLALIYAFINIIGVYSFLKLAQQRSKGKGQ